MHQFRLDYESISGTTDAVQSGVAVAAHDGGGGK